MALVAFSSGANAVDGTRPLVSGADRNGGLLALDQPERDDGRLDRIEDRRERRADRRDRFCDKHPHLCRHRVSED